MSLRDDSRAHDAGGDPAALRAPARRGGGGLLSSPGARPATAGREAPGLADAGTSLTSFTDEAADSGVPAKPAARPASMDHRITRPALDHLDGLRRESFIRFGSMRIADHVAVGEAIERLTMRDGVVDLQPQGPIDRHIAERLRQRAVADDDEAAADGPDDAARHRRAWDEAKRTGDPDAMTRTANALLRAVEEARAHLGEREAAHVAPREHGRHPTSEILNPQGGQSQRAAGADTEAALPPSNGIADSDEFAKFNTPLRDQDIRDFVPMRASEANSDAELPPGESARIPVESTAESGELTRLTDAQTQAVADFIMSWPAEPRSKLRRQLRERFSGPAPTLARLVVAERRPYGGEAAPFSLLAARRESTDSLYRVQDRPGSRQRSYQPRDQTWEEWLWDWWPERWGGPKDEFTSAPEDDRPPFDPNVGYYGRLHGRLRQATQRFSHAEGVDIDGIHYQSLLMVGSNLDGTTTQGLSPAGIAFLISVLSDRQERFRTAEEAAEFVAVSERAARREVTPAQREAYVRSFKSGRGATVGLLDGVQYAGDELQTIILIDSAFDGLVPEGREYAEAVVLAHELGHVASNVLRVGEVFENLPAYERDQVAKELERAFQASRMSQGAITGRGSWELSAKEWFAETFMMYLTDPEFAKREAPLTCGVLRRLWNNDPILNQILRLS